MVIKTRMQSIDYTNNYSFKNSVYDIFKGWNPILTILISGNILCLSYYFINLYSINAFGVKLKTMVG